MNRNKITFTCGQEEMDYCTSDGICGKKSKNPDEISNNRANSGQINLWEQKSYVILGKTAETHDLICEKCKI